MVDKITNPPSQKDLIDKVNELVDDKQDTLVSGTNIKTINNTSILGSGNIDIQGGGSSYTAGTGIDITNDVISVEGVKDQRNTSTAIKTWSGTRAQYDAIATKDSNTLYNITDDTDVSLTILEALYPVGAVYIGIMEVCPLQMLGVGTWTKVSSGRVLQGADSGHNAGTTIEAGLPNITGTIPYMGTGGTGGDTSSGAFNNNVVQGAGYGTSGNWHLASDVTFDASRSSSIYGNSTTVQPPAFVVNIWQRTA